MVATTDFNPHEREARDALHIVRVIVLSYFNPHEREARDVRIMCSRLRPVGF